MPINMQIEYPKLIAENTKLRMALEWIQNEINHEDFEAIRHKAIFLDFDELLTDIDRKIREVI